MTGSRQMPAVHEAWLPREHSMHRPRHGGRQIVALVCATIFLLLPSALWLVGLRPGQIENHKLAGFPSVSDGWGLFTGLPKWADDQLIFRGAAIDAERAVSKGVFGEPPPLGTNTDAPTGPLPAQPAPKPTKPVMDDATTSRVIEGDDDWLYLADDVKSKCGSKYAATITLLKRMRKLIERSGRTFVLVIAPNKTTMVPQFLPETYADKKCSDKVTGPLWNSLTQGAKALDLRPGLTTLAKDMGHPAYPPTDTHWSDEGSVLMTRSIAETVHPGSTRTWKVQSDGQYSTPADLLPMIGETGDKTETTYAVMPDGKTNRTVKGLKSINHPVGRRAQPIAGTTKGRTIVFGDSFTLAASKYLPAAFSDLTMYSYDEAGGNADKTIDRMLSSKVVVLEMVERAVSEGTTGMVNKGFVKRLSQRMAHASKPR